MTNRNIIVAGASAGGVEALRNFVKSLPADIKASVFIVLHIPPYTKSFLPEILSKKTLLTVSHPRDGEAIEEGHVYVAPPDHHLLVEKDKVAIKKGPKENRFRPSIDALFRSAAYVYGARVIGIIFSGALDDGTSGLWSIKRLGGVSIIQDPAEAPFPEMPLSVTEYVDVDHVAAAEDMGELLGRLTKERAPETAVILEGEKRLLEKEIAISAEGNAFQLGIMDEGDLTALTCPECHGSLVKFTKGKIVKYTCHTGHSFSASSLLAGITDVVETMLTQSVRAMEEATMLMRNIAGHFEESGATEAADLFREKARQCEHKAQIIHDTILQEEHLSKDITLNKELKRVV